MSQWMLYDAVLIALEGAVEELELLNEDGISGPELADLVYRIRMLQGRMRRVEGALERSCCAQMRDQGVKNFDLGGVSYEVKRSASTKWDSEEVLKFLREKHPHEPAKQLAGLIEVASFGYFRKGVLTDMGASKADLEDMADVTWGVDKLKILGPSQ
jgi:hypothetical protein